MNRKKLILFILLLAFAGAVVWSYLSVPRLKSVDTSKPRTAPQSVRPVPAKPAPAALAAVKPDERTLRLDLLEREQSGFSGYRRNIFKPLFVDEIKMMKMKAAAVKPVPLPPVAVQPQKPVVAVAPTDSASQAETTQSTLAKFTFLGFLKKDNRRTIFLAKDKDIILVKKGDKFAGRYEASSITDQALTITVSDSGEQIVIPLQENKPLKAAAK